MQIILRIFSIILFPITLLTTLLLTEKAPYNLLHYYLIWFFPVFIIVNWTNLKMFGGIFTFLVTILVTVYTWMVTGNAGYLLINIPASTLAILLFIQEERFKSSITNLQLSVDHEELEYNLLLQEFKKQENLQAAYYKKTKRSARLSQIAENLAFSLTPEEIHRQAINDLAQTIDSGDIYLLWEVGGDLQTLVLKVLESPKGVSKPESIHSDEFNMWTMRHRQPLLITDIAKDYRFNTTEILSKTSVKSLIAAPLMTEDKIMGILRIDSSIREAFSLDDLRLLAIIANITALTIQNAQLFKETEYLATRDSLTNLYVKRYFLENLERLTEEAKIKGSSFSVLLIDIDKFKSLNDQYGHSVGDRVLQKVGQLIQEEAGTSNISARYGGEEFVVLLPNTTKQEAGKVAEKMRKRIAEEVLSVRREGLATTISIGVAESIVDGSSPASLIDKADKALYKAKHKGRNMVVTA